MSELIIKNVGPIKSVKINLNKVNVFIGPQSSGKSTIAKIISYCQWVEKRFVLDGEFDYDFTEEFIEFHRIDKNYFDPDSLIHYKSKFISIKYRGLGNEEIEINDSERNHLKKSKNIYIPAERNFVSSIPNLNKYNETNDNIMSFLYDWYDAKSSYNKNEPFSILNLNHTYHHDSEEKRDILKLNENKEISLKNASSGLQSIVPLLMLVDYLTDKIFKKEIPLSVKEKMQSHKNDYESIRNYVKKELDELKVIKENFQTKIDNAIKKKNFDEELFKEYEKNNFENRLYELGLLLDQIDPDMDGLRKYYYSKIIIEEPEQNLFPETQRDLMYHLINKVQDNERNHQLTLTTHSPYILYALNNSMLGYLVREQIDAAEVSQLKSYDSWINPELVAVWEIKDGQLLTIQNKETGTISDHYFNNVMDELLGEYYDMLSYLEV